MIRHDLVKRGHIGHALISSSKYPNIFIPAKVVIKDIKFHEYNPRYKVKIIKFYDNLHFINTYFVNMPFQNEFDNRSQLLYIEKDAKFRNTDEFCAYMNKHEDRFYIIVESINVVKTKMEMQDLFNKLQTFIIEKSIKHTMLSCTRPLYKGMYKMSTKKEFFSRIRGMLINLVAKSEDQWTKWVKSMS